MRDGAGSEFSQVEDVPCPTSTLVGMLRLTTLHTFHARARAFTGRPLMQEHVNDIVMMTFQYLNMIRDEGLQVKISVEQGISHSTDSIFGSLSPPTTRFPLTTMTAVSPGGYIVRVHYGVYF